MLVCRKHKKLWTCRLIIPFLLGVAIQAQAHNGQVALAYPLADIAVDGDLSDWPEEVKRYPIAHAEYGDKPGNAADFRGFLRVGYNEWENALYLAVEVEDESTVIDTSLTLHWNTQDGCEIYVDLLHLEDGEPPINITFGGLLGELSKGRLQLRSKATWRSKCNGGLCPAM